MTTRILPPEWAPQRATLLVWPRQDGDWSDGLAQARDAIAALAAVLCDYQPVVLAANDPESRNSIATRADLTGLGGLTVLDAPNDDIWARDTGPITVLDDGEHRFLDFRFDGWGGQFAARRDDAFTRAVHATGALGSGALERHELTLEGGSIEVNGAGALLTTERCLIQGRRNAGMDRARAAELLGDTLGVESVHWLSRGELIGDDTDGHIDTLARFVAADTLVYQGCRDRDDAHYAALAAMADELAALRDKRGQPYRLVELPLPRAIHDPEDGHRLPAGYANFLIANGCVVMPAFNDPADGIAREIIAGLFRQRDIRAVDSRALIRQHGGLHCAAMQIPAER